MGVPPMIPNHGEDARATVKKKEHGQDARATR